MPSEDFIQSCERIAQQHFAIPSLRDQQRQVLQHIDAGASCLVTMPTGSGKTLLYALPACVWIGGLVVVVCPLLALMRDQVRRMTESGMVAVTIHGEQTEDARLESYRSLRSGKCQILFVSPERFTLDSFVTFLSQLDIRMYVIDEAHCIVSWGTHFRPEYRMIRDVLVRLRAKRVLALTATAAPSTRRQIAANVFPNPKDVVHVESRPIRDNIQFETIRVFSEDEKWITCQAKITQSRAPRILVYLNKRKDCEDYAVRLKSRRAVVYHAGMSRQQREDAEVYVRSSKEPVVVFATLAFGMGIDLANVECVMVIGFPSNVEELFQMMGRAGRSGQKCHAFLIWSGSDPRKREYQFDKTFLNVTDFKRAVLRLSDIFPKPADSRFVSLQDLRSRLFGASVKDEDPVEGVIAGLRMLNAVSVIAQYTCYVEIVFSAQWQEIRATVPQSVTQRSLLLDALESLIVENHPTMKGSYPNRKVIVSLPALASRSGLSIQSVTAVLTHFNAMFRFTLREECRDQFWITDSLDSILSKMDVYAKLRCELKESLKQLEGIAHSSDCRLSNAFRFFSGKPSPLSPCGQCDLCYLKNKHLNKIQAIER